MLIIRLQFHFYGFHIIHNNGNKLFIIIYSLILLAFFSIFSFTYSSLKILQCVTHLVLTIFTIWSYKCHVINLQTRLLNWMKKTPLKQLDHETKIMQVTNTGDA